MDNESMDGIREGWRDGKADGRMDGWTERYIGK
jgi:hypothetical protein